MQASLHLAIPSIASAAALAKAMLGVSAISSASHATHLTLGGWHMCCTARCCQCKSCNFISRLQCPGHDVAGRVQQCLLADFDFERRQVGEGRDMACCAPCHTQSTTEGGPNLIPKASNFGTRKHLACVKVYRPEAQPNNGSSRGCSCSLSRARSVRFRVSKIALLEFQRNGNGRSPGLQA